MLQNCRFIVKTLKQYRYEVNFLLLFAISSQNLTKTTGEMYV